MAERTDSLFTKKAGSSSLDEVPKAPAAGDAFIQGAQISAGLGLLEEGLGGFADIQGLGAKAEVFEFNAKQEELKGESDALKALEAMNDTQASNIVAAFASGVQLQGSIQTAQAKVGRKAAFVIGLATANADIKAGALKREARRLRAERDYNAGLGGFLKTTAGAGLLALALS